MPNLTTEQQQKLKESIESHITEKGVHHTAWLAMAKRLGTEKKKLAFHLLVRVAKKVMLEEDWPGCALLSEQHQVIPTLLERIEQKVSQSSYQDKDPVVIEELIENIREQLKKVAEVSAHIDSISQGKQIAQEVLAGTQWNVVLQEPNSKAVREAQDPTVQSEVKELLELLCSELMNSPLRLELTQLDPKNVYVPVLRGVIKRVGERPANKAERAEYYQSQASLLCQKIQEKVQVSHGQAAEHDVVPLASELRVHRPDVVNLVFDFMPQVGCHYVYNGANKALKYNLPSITAKEIKEKFSKKKWKKVPSTANMVSTALEHGNLQSQARSVDIVGETPNKKALIQQTVHQAIEDALNLYDGKLFMEPVGLEFDDVTPAWYADIVAKEISSLAPQHASLLNITIPISHEPKSKLFDQALSQKLLQLKLKAWILDAFNIDAAEQASVQQIEQLLATLYQPLWQDRLPKCFEKLFNAGANAPENPTARQQESYLDTKREVYDYFKKLFTAEVLDTSNSPAQLVDGYQAALKQNAIAVELELVKNEHSWDGFTDQMRNGLFIESDTQLLAPDVRSALYQLALENQEKADALLDVLVCTKGTIQEHLELIAKDDRYPRHIIIHNSQRENAVMGHWTRLSVEKQGEQVTLCYVDSMAKPSTSFLPQGKALTNIFPKVKVEAVGLNHQTDGWTCGYHALAGVARELGLTGVSNTDCRTDGSNRVKGLRNWVFKLVTGRTYEQYAAENNRPLTSGSNTFGLRSFRPSTTGAASAPLLTTASETNIPFRASLLKVDARVAPRALQDTIRSFEARHKRFSEYLKMLAVQVHHKPLAFDGFAAELVSAKADIEQLQQLYQTLKSQCLITFDKDMRSKVLEPVQIKLEALETELLTLEHIFGLKQSAHRLEPTTSGSAMERLHSLSGALPVVDQGAAPLSAREKLRYKSLLSLFDEKLKELVNPKFSFLCSTGYLIRSKEKHQQIIAANNAIRDQLLFERGFELSELDPATRADYRKRLDNDPERIRRVLAAWDDNTSELFRALNKKRSTFMGYPLTLFSGQSWRDVVDGDSAMVKGMKQVDTLKPQAQESTSTWDFDLKL